MFIAGLFALFYWAHWYIRVSSITDMASRAADRWALLLSPPLCLGILFFVARRWSSTDARDDPEYIAFYLGFGTAWIAISVQLFSWMGLCAVSDIAERHIAGAGYAFFGAMLGVTFAFSGAIAGNGPDVFVDFTHAVLSTGMWFSLWAVLEACTHIGEKMTIERSRAAGLRLCGILISSGLVLGRAVAGDYKSMQHSLADFVVVGWPVLPFGVLVIALERRLTGRSSESQMVTGAIPAIAMIGLAAGYLFLKGPW